MCWFWAFFCICCCILSAKQVHPQSRKYGRRDFCSKIYNQKIPVVGILPSYSPRYYLHPRSPFTRCACCRKTIHLQCSSQTLYPLWKSHIWLERIIVPFCFVLPIFFTHVHRVSCLDYTPVHIHLHPCGLLLLYIWKVHLPQAPTRVDLRNFITLTTELSSSMKRGHDGLLAETFVFGWISTGIPRPLSATRMQSLAKARLLSCLQIRPWLRRELSKSPHQVVASRLCLLYLCTFQAFCVQALNPGQRYFLPYLLAFFLSSWHNVNKSLDFKALYANVLLPFHSSIIAYNLPIHKNGFH